MALLYLLGPYLFFPAGLGFLVTVPLGLAAVGMAKGPALDRRTPPFYRMLALIASALGAVALLAPVIAVVMAPTICVTQHNC